MRNLSFLKSFSEISDLHFEKASSHTPTTLPTNNTQNVHLEALKTAKWRTS